MSPAAGAPVDLEYERSVLADASCERTYEAICDVGALLAHLPEVEDVTVTRDGAEASAVVVFGPGLRLQAESHLDQLEPLKAVDMTTEIPGIATRVRISLDLDCSDRDQTLVRCAARVTCAHRRARWLRRSLMAALERNVDVFVESLSARISRNARAERIFAPASARRDR